MCKEFEDPIDDYHEVFSFDGDVMDDELSSAIDLLPEPLQESLVSFFGQLDALIPENNGYENIVRAMSKFMGDLKVGGDMKKERSVWFARVESSFTTYLDDSDRKPELYMVTSFEADPGIVSRDNPKLRTHSFNQECWFDGIPGFREFCIAIEDQLYSLYNYILTWGNELGLTAGVPVHISFVFSGDFAENFRSMVKGVPDEGLKPWMISLRDSDLDPGTETGDILFEVFPLKEIIGDKILDIPGCEQVLSGPMDPECSPEEREVLTAYENPTKSK